MTSSPTIESLAKALAIAQGKIEGAAKDGENPFFKRGNEPSRYATLASVWDACREALSSNGLSVIQMPGDYLADEHGGRMTMTTRLCHSSGEWIEETMTIPVAKLDPQGAVAAITYARRAALSAFVGVAPVDDDGNEAAGNSAKERPKPELVQDSGKRWLAAIVNGLVKSESWEILGVDAETGKALNRRDAAGDFARTTLMQTHLKRMPNGSEDDFKTVAAILADRRDGALKP